MTARYQPDRNNPLFNRFSSEEYISLPPFKTQQQKDTSVYNTSTNNQYQHLTNQLPSKEYLPPNSEDFQIMSRIKSSEKDPLQRLEVETASSSSVPISFPYYYIESAANSISSHKEESTPVFSNISHNLPPVPTKSVNDEIKSEGFNQVPKRFSQFVREQHVPYNRHQSTSTSNSSSLGSESDTPVKRKSHSTLGGLGPRAKTASMASNPLRTPPLGSGLNRQISESMGSQATIFSTRLEGENNNVRRRRVQKSQSDNSLTRRNAIRFKEGGLLYRMKLRLKKWLNNLRRLRFHKTASSKRMSRNNSVKNKSLKRKGKKPGMKKIMNISAPIANPNLGKEPVKRVRELDDDLKYEAGAPMENVNLLDEAKKDSKLSHLDEYIGQQQGLYFSDIESKTNSINYGRDQSLKEIKANAKHRPSKSKNKIDEIEEVPLSEYSSIAPPPPKHGDETVISDYHDMVDLWRKYLFFVLYKRIQLRQEISMFQTMLASEDLKSRKLSIGSQLNSIYEVESKSEDTISESGTLASSYETISTVSQVQDIKGVDDLVNVDVEDEIESDFETEIETELSEGIVIHQFIPDANDERFNKRYTSTNRQSVLGDMLEYESDDELTISSVSSNNYQSVTERSNSILGSNIAIDKQYSVKHKNLSRSMSTMSGTKSPIKRSNGYQLDLHLAS